MKYVKRFFKLALVLLIGAIIIFFENNYIVTDRINIDSNGKLDGVKILHLSDLHNKRIENLFSSFRNNISQNKPDIILITGDIIGNNNDDSLNYIDYLKSSFDDIAVYYVNGNHEYADYSFLKQFNKKMKDNGFICLDGIGKTIKIRGKELYLAGLKDPNAYEKTTDVMVKERIEMLETQSKAFKILLTHRAIYTPIYNQSNFDLILCGHAHGGVIGIPFTSRGLYATGEGFFPKYVKGMHGKTYISQGLGPCRFFTRLFNHPRMSYITIT